MAVRFLVPQTLVLAAGLGLAACQTGPDGQMQPSRAGTGAAIGAVAGGVLGNVLSDSGVHTENTVIGAAAGAAVGGGLGYMFDRQERAFEERLAQERAQNQVEVERVREDLLRLTMDSEVSFDVDSAAIRPGFRDTIGKVGAVLQDYPRTRATIVGHTDATGGEAYNQRLSERRAEAVRNELMANGVPGERLVAVGRGESEPRASNDSEAGRQLNRRVEVLLQPMS